MSCWLLKLICVCVCFCYCSVNTTQAHVWKVMRQRACRPMSQDDSTYVFYPCVYGQSKQKQTVSVDQHTDNNPRTSVNRPEPRRFMSHLRNELLYYFVYVFLHTSRHLFSVCPSSPSSSLHRSPTLSMPVCTDLSPSSSPARRTGASSVSSFRPAHSHRFAQVPRGLTPNQRPDRVCALCLLHVWSFSSV